MREELGNKDLPLQDAVLISEYPSKDRIFLWAVMETSKASDTGPAKGAYHWAYYSTDLPPPPAAHYSNA